MKRFILVLSFIASVLVLFGQGHTHIPPTFRFNGGPITIECKSNEIEKKYTRYGYITEVFNGVDISSPTQGLKRIEAPIYLEEKQGWVTITGARDESVYFSLAYVPAYSNSTTLFNDLIDCLSEVNATATTIVDTSGYYSSGTVEGALQEVGDSIDVLRTDLTAIAAGASDGVATSGAYDAGNEEIDITVAAPGSDFAIDVSDLATDSDVVDSLAQLRSEIPTNVSELTNDAGYLTSETDAIALAALGDTSTAIRADIPVNVSELTNDSGYLTTEVDGSITNELQDADEVPIDDAGGYFIGTNVEDALQNVGSTILAFSNMLASKTDSVTATLLNDSTFLINNYIGGSIFRADTIIISGGGTTYTGGYGIDITGSTIEADTSDLATQSDVVELSETIADSSHWFRILDDVYYTDGDVRPSKNISWDNPYVEHRITGETVTYNGEDLPSGYLVFSPADTANNKGGDVGFFAPSEFENLDYSTGNLLFQTGDVRTIPAKAGDITLDAGSSISTAGGGNVNLLAGGKNTSTGVGGKILLQTRYTRYSATSQGSTGHIEITTKSPYNGTPGRIGAGNIYLTGGTRVNTTTSQQKNNMGSIFLTSGFDSLNTLHNGRIELNGYDQSNTLSDGLHIYFSDHNNPNAWKASINSSYLPLGLKTEPDNVDYTLTIGDNSNDNAAIRLFPHTSSLTTTSGLLYAHSTDGWKMSNADGSEMLRPALYEDAAPADGDILVYNAANSRYENENPQARSYTPSATGDTNGDEGDIAYDDDYIYVKTSAGWKRAALSTF